MKSLLTTEENVASADKFTVHIDLRHSWPLAVQHQPSIPPSSTINDQTHENSLMPVLNSGSASTLNVFIFSGGTPCKSST